MSRGAELLRSLLQELNSCRWHAELLTVWAVWRIVQNGQVWHHLVYIQNVGFRYGNSQAVSSMLVSWRIIQLQTCLMTDYSVTDLCHDGLFSYRLVWWRIIQLQTCLMTDYSVTDLCHEGLFSYRLVWWQIILLQTCHLCERCNKACEANLHSIIHWACDFSKFRYVQHIYNLGQVRSWLSHCLFYACFSHTRSSRCTDFSVAYIVGDCE